MLEFLRKNCVFILLISGAFLVGILVMSIMDGKQSPVSAKQDCSNGFPFISEEIDCEKIDDIADQVNELHSNISGIIEEEKNSQNLVRASVFYRDLKSRRWFGINDLEKYYPASLLKLPMAITYYKIAELQPEIFNQSLTIPTEQGFADNANQHYKPDNPLTQGEAYSIREMIDHMLLYSDNAPFSVLSESAGVFYGRVFADLGVYSSPENIGEENWNYSPRIFANIFRMLYNASYVNIQSSNEILDLLSRSTFKNGIVAGVPREVKVSHKFGEAAAVDNENNVRSLILNDCGIVYKSEKPYILCVMTEGHDYPKLEKVIERISAEAYSAF